MKVDNSSTVAYNNKRDTVRIASKDRYGVGSIWIADMYHVPYGVSAVSSPPLDSAVTFFSWLTVLRLASMVSTSLFIDVKCRCSCLII